MMRKEHELFRGLVCSYCNDSHVIDHNIDKLTIVAHGFVIKLFVSCHKCGAPIIALYNMISCDDGIPERDQKMLNNIERATNNNKEF